LSKTDVESQPQADSGEEGTDKKNEIEHVEPAIKKPRVLKGDSTLNHPKTDVESRPQADSGEEATDQKNKIEQVEPAIKKPRLAEQIELSRKSPVDEERKRFSLIPEDRVD
jgi:hypothetical protein